jgi:hypothetical protein
MYYRFKPNNLDLLSRTFSYYANYNDITPYKLHLFLPPDDDATLPQIPVQM